MQGPQTTDNGARFDKGGGLRLVAQSTPDDVRQTLGHVRTALDPHQTQVDPGWEIVLAEVLNNIVEHAFGEGAPGQITLWLSLSSDGLHVRIEDAGREMPGLALPKGDPPDVDVSHQDLPEGGFGWFLIRSMTRDLQYARRTGINQTSFVIPALG